MERVNAQLDQVEGIVESVRVMTEDVSRLTTDATDVVHDAKNVVVGVIGMVDNVQSSVQRPVNEIMTIFRPSNAEFQSLMRISSVVTTSRFGSMK